MEVSSYAMDLYCDIDNPQHLYNEFPHSFTGETNAECKKQARKRGWKFKKDGTVVCPKCVRKGY